MVEQFEDFKANIENTFLTLKVLVTDVNALVSSIEEDDILKVIYKKESSLKIKKMQESIDVHLDALKRKQMKCVFFGQTSNGKSSMINALLGEKILPSSDGRTTSCFITIDGCEGDEYFMVDDSAKKHDIDKLFDMANEISSKSLEISSFIKLFWPNDKCPLLKDNVQLLDSPGVDFSVNNDAWIEKYCIDSDVFVYVVNSEASIHECERKFFRKVKTIIKNPNILIVMNKWDKCEEKEKKSRVDKVRQQHLDTAKDFLHNDLKLSCDINNNTFFLSAMEQLRGPDDSKRMEDGYNDYLGKVKGRKDEFDRFFERLCEDMVANAIRTKCGPHLDTSEVYLSDMLAFLEELENNRKKRSLKIIDLINKVKESIEEVFKKMAEEAEVEVNYQSSSFAEAIVTDYQRGEFSENRFSDFVRQKIIEAVIVLFKSTLGHVRSKVKGLLISHSQFELSQDTLNRYLPPESNDNLSSFEKSLSLNLKRVNIQVERECDDTALKVNESNKGAEVTSKLGEIGEAIAVPMMIMFPWRGLLTLATSSILKSGLFDDPNKMKNAMKQIKDQTAVLLTEYMTKCLKECHKEIEEEIETLMKKFVEDHEKACGIISSIMSFKVRCKELQVDIETKRKSIT